jgi:hypothetical protein
VPEQKFSGILFAAQKPSFFKKLGFYGIRTRVFSKNSGSMESETEFFQYGIRNRVFSTNSIPGLSFLKKNSIRG